MAKPRQTALGWYSRRLLRFQKCFNVSYWRHRRDIYREGSTDRGKEVNDEGESGHEEGIKEGRAGGNDGDSEASGLKRTAAVVVRVRMGQERTKRGMVVGTKNEGRTGVCTE